MFYLYKFSICLQLIVPWERNIIQNNKELNQEDQQMETHITSTFHHCLWMDSMLRNCTFSCNYICLVLEYNMHL